jgi:hypothetical protein
MTGSLVNSPTPISISRAFAQLADFDDRSGSEHTQVRIGRQDGTTIEGRLFGIDATDLTLVDHATGGLTKVPASEVRSLEVEAPRRAREWIIAALGVVAAVFALAGWAMLPWVRPRAEGDMMLGFIFILLVAGPALSALFARPSLRRWMTTWKTLYPPG